MMDIAIMFFLDENEIAIVPHEVIKVLDLIYLHMARITECE